MTTINDTNTQALSSITDVAVSKAIDALPSDLQPIAKNYAPALIGMSIAEFLAWCSKLHNLSTAEQARADFYKRLNTNTLLDQGDTITSQWATAWKNDRNREALGEAIYNAVFIKVIVPMLLTLLVGL